MAASAVCAMRGSMQATTSTNAANSSGWSRVGLSRTCIPPSRSIPTQPTAHEAHESAVLVAATDADADAKA